MRSVLVAARADVAPNELSNDRSGAAGLIFAGGRSSRMGTDKALIDIGGEPLISRVLRAVRSLHPVVIVGGQSENFQALDASWCGDEHPGDGPLGALITGMHVVRSKIVVGVACDLPNLAPQHVQQLVEQLQRSTACVAAPLVSGTHQWHVAAWQRDCLPQLETAFSRGERSLRRVALELGVVSVVFADNTSFVDVDTPDDFTQAFPE